MGIEKKKLQYHHQEYIWYDEGVHYECCQDTRMCKILYAHEVPEKCGEIVL